MADQEVPVNQGKSSEVGYKKPPVEHQFKPGQSGNPSGLPGRPKASIIKHVEELLLNADESESKRMAQAILDHFASGNGTAIKEIMSRIDGPIVQPIQVDDVSGLTDSERAARTLTLLDRARARRAGQADGESEPS